MTVPLPGHAYIPGRTARHPEGRFDALRGGALCPTLSATAGRNPAFQSGLDFLEAGYFWEAHEVLEPVWMNAPANAPERFLVQALIQLANAALKHRMGRPNASRRLCAMAAGLLDRSGPPGASVMGLEIDRIRRAAVIMAGSGAGEDPVVIRVRPGPAS